jgi:SNF2 family DNA or RNA helicase
MKPFLEKTWVTIQPRFAAEYARKILVPDLEMGIAELNGSYVQETIPLTAADVYFSFEFEGSQLGLFDAQAKGAKDLKLPPLLSCEIRFLYGKWESKTFSENGTWIFHEGEIPKLERIGRDAGEEARLVNQLEQIWNLKFAQNKAKLGFVHLRDAVLNQLDQVPDMVKIRFSPEFNQLVMGKPRLDVRVFEKIDYFKIEGSIDWDGETYDLFKLRSSIRIEEGWLKIGEAYFPLQDGEQLFLSQLLSLSQTQDQEWTLPKTTVRAISENRTGVFAEAWNKVTGLLANLQKPPKVTSESLSPNFLLREYQVKGVQWFLHLATNGLGGILADDMGLGKTFQAAAYLRYMRNLEPDKKGLSLIVMPSTLIFNWQYELKRFSPDFKVYVHSGPQRMPSLKGLQDYFNVVLVSFQTLVRDTRLFSAIEFDNLIVDEAHYLKNPGTAAYKAAKALNAKRTFLLTGTPLQNSPADLWALSELCNPGLLSSKIKPAALQKMDNLVRFQESMKLLQGLVSPFLLRRTKENVLTELPEKSVSVLYCSMTEEQEIEYLAYNQFVSGELSDLSYQNASSRSVRILKALTALRLMANHPALVDDSFGHASGKFDLVCEKLEEVLQEGRKVLIFSSFVRHLNLFAKHLETRGFGFTMLTGKTGNRKEVVDRFKTDTDCNVFLISLKAGGFGLNLVEASYVFLLDPWWNPAAENQAMDRVYRIGQKNKVSVYKFITSNTVEEKILKLQERKSSLNDQLFENDEANPGKFSLDTLKEILIQNL